MERPPFCIAEDCTPVRPIPDRLLEELQGGGSFFCAGILREKRVWRAGRTRHDNRWSFCVYSPFKGWLHFFICRNDALIISGLMQQLLHTRTRKVVRGMFKKVCPNCGRDSYSSGADLWICPYCGADLTNEPKLRPSPEREEGTPCRKSEKS